MKWRVMLELVGPDGIVGVHEIGGRAAVAEYAPHMIGLTLEEGKHLLAALQVHLVRAQAEDHCRHRRRCQRCGAQRPLKDQRSRRLVSLFGTVEVRAPRFTPCRCAVTCRRTLNPVAKIMPDRCTPEYERTIAKMGSLLPYRRARTLLAELLPPGKPQAVETTRQRTLRADGPRSLGEAASPGPTHHVLDWFHLAMRVQHVAQAATSWPDATETDRQAGVRLTETIERIRWRLWHGQVKRALDLIAETVIIVDAIAARKVARLLGDLETYVSGQSNIIIDYATARRREEPISTAITESTVQWLLHRRMDAQQQRRWSPRGAHLMLKVRTSVVNGTLNRDYAVAERWGRRPFRRAA